MLITVKALLETSKDTQRSETTEPAGDSQLESQDCRLWNCETPVIIWQF